MTARYRATIIRFDEVITAVTSGADTYTAIAATLNVPVTDPDLAATLNAMRHQRRIDFAGGCCTQSMEHTYDCQVTLPCVTLTNPPQGTTSR